MGGGSGEVEGLLTLSGRDQQFLSHGLYAGVVRQLQVVDAGHDRRQEVVRVLRRLERLPHDSQRGVQAPETWDKTQASVQIERHNRKRKEPKKILNLLLRFDSDM